jgi:REP element-mobilizing transposase RayT
MPAGLDVITAWEGLPERFGDLALLEFVAMPDHVHGLIQLGSSDIEDDADATGETNLGTVVGAFKSLSARAANQTLGRRNVSFWQRGYYDRVVPSDDELERLRWYIVENPARWAAARYSQLNERT